MEHDPDFLALIQAELERGVNFGAAPNLPPTPAQTMALELLAQSAHFIAANQALALMTKPEAVTVLETVRVRAATNKRTYTLRVGFGRVEPGSQLTTPLSKIVVPFSRHGRWDLYPNETRTTGVYEGPYIVNRNGVDIMEDPRELKRLTEWRPEGGVFAFNVYAGDEVAVRTIRNLGRILGFDVKEALKLIS